MGSLLELLHGEKQGWEKPVVWGSWDSLWAGGRDFLLVFGNML